ncbi:MAG: NAD(P)/FAD-dependent oxidoreductase [Bacillota bacterium]
MTAPRLVVLGAGFGGLSFLRSLEKDPVSRGLEVMLVDRNAYTTLVPELYAVAAGTADAGAVTVPIRLPERRFRQAEVSGLDLAPREVLLTSGRLAYDYLVVALGSRNQFYGVPGAAEHTRTLRTLEEALAVRREIQHLPAGASVAVVGGGLTGLEVTAEVAATRPDLKLTLLEALPYLANGFPAGQQAWVRGELERQGVQVRTQTQVQRVEPGLLHLAGTDPVPFDLAIWAAGVTPPPLLREAGLAVDRQGRVLVDQAQRSLTDPRVFVVGDCAAGPAAPSAQLAELQGQRAAVALGALLRGEEAAPQPLRLRGTLASLGPRQGFGTLGPLPLAGSVPVRGRLPLRLKHMVTARYREDVRRFLSRPGKEAAAGPVVDTRKASG